jgi:hypothetical protein
MVRSRVIRNTRHSCHAGLGLAARGPTHHTSSVRQWQSLDSPILLGGGMVRGLPRTKWPMAELLYNPFPAMSRNRPKNLGMPPLCTQVDTLMCHAYGLLHENHRRH